MVDADSYYGEYLKAEDVKKDIRVRIKAVTEENIDGETKLAIEFEGIRKRLVLNKTNKDTIKKIAGTSETDSWAGMSITLGTEMVRYKGEMVPALRVKETAERQQELGEKAS
jgi:hypothetical protein